MPSEPAVSIAVYITEDQRKIMLSKSIGEAMMPGKKKASTLSIEALHATIKALQKVGF